MNRIRIKNSKLSKSNKIKEDFLANEIYKQLYLYYAIEESEEDIKAGRIYTHEQVKKMTEKWLKKS